MPINNLKKANNLSTNILNYFAAFTETRFNFRTLINYRWTNSELTLDLAIFQDFQDTLLQRIKAGDKTPIRVKSNEHILTLSGDEILPEINKTLSNKFGAEYLEGFIEQERREITERDKTPVDTETGIPPDDKPTLSEEDIDRQNKQAFVEGCRKYNLALRKQIELVLVELQEKKINHLKEELGIEHVPPSTFNSANYLKSILTRFSLSRAITEP